MTSPETFTPSEQSLDALDVLDDLQVDQEALREIASILFTNATTLEWQLPEVPEHAFGLSERGEAMGRHTRLAHDFVVQSVAEVVRDLVGQQQAILDYAGSAAQADEQTHDDLTALLARLTAAAPWADGPTPDRGAQEHNDTEGLTS